MSYIRDCSTCDGKGRVLSYPYYSVPMPEMLWIKCNDCAGFGKLNVLDNPYPVMFKRELSVAPELKIIPFIKETKKTQKILS